MAQNSSFSHFCYLVRHNLLTFVAFGFFLILVIVALGGPVLAPYDPLASDSASALQGPSGSHWFGTDQLGRDILSRVLVATRLDLGISVIAVALSFALGSLLGTWAGYWGGGSIG